MPTVQKYIVISQAYDQYFGAITESMEQNDSNPSKATKMAFEFPSFLCKEACSYESTLRLLLSYLSIALISDTFLILKCSIQMT